LVLSIGETNAAYNQFTLPLVDHQDITICTYFKSAFKPSDKITLFEGDNTITGFLRVLNAALAAKRYDVVHTHSSHVGLFFLIATLFRSLKDTPPAVLTLHSSFPNYKLKHKALLIPVFVASRKLICCSRASYDSVPGLYRWLARDKLCMIRNGVNLNRIDETLQREPRLSKHNQFTVVSVGRLIDVKNPLLLLEAFRNSGDSNSRLIFVGEGDLRDGLSKQIREFDAQDRIKLTGVMPREEVYRYLVRSDVFVSTSTVEGMPMAVLEAMACRCPVVLSDIPAHREIAEGVDFIPLLEPNDVKGFAEQIQRFRRMSGDEIAEIGERCRQLVEQQFDLKSMLDAYTAKYTEICRGCRG
jgi:glycosyltransferase involved in cell wall biosynthesis